jgi:hypothetical protein
MNNSEFNFLSSPYVDYLRHSDIQPSVFKQHQISSPHHDSIYNRQPQESNSSGDADPDILKDVPPKNSAHRRIIKSHKTLASNGPNPKFSKQKDRSGPKKPTGPQSGQENRTE